jgi:hypothetical protein
VAAFIVSRHGPASSSAARRKTDARASHESADHSRRASAAAAIARATSCSPPWWYVPRTCWWSWGMTTSAVRPVRTASPPITIGISTCRPAISSRRALRLARSGDPGG